MTSLRRCDETVVKPIKYEDFIYSPWRKVEPVLPDNQTTAFKQHFDEIIEVRKTRIYSPQWLSKFDTCFLHNFFKLLEEAGVCNASVTLTGNGTPNAHISVSRGISDDVLADHAEFDPEDGYPEKQPYLGMLVVYVPEDGTPLRAFVPKDVTDQMFPGPRTEEGTVYLATSGVYGRYLAEGEKPSEERCCLTD